MSGSHPVKRFSNLSLRDPGDRGSLVMYCNPNFLFQRGMFTHQKHWDGRIDACTWSSSFTLDCNHPWWRKKLRGWLFEFRDRATDMHRVTASCKYLDVGRNKWTCDLLKSLGKMLSRIFCNNACTFIKIRVGSNDRRWIHTNLCISPQEKLVYLWFLLA